MIFFEAENISAGYKDKEVLKSLSFSSQENTIVGIIGANGSGKSTLMKSICKIIPHKGRCILDGVVLEELSAKQISRICSYIPQRSGISIDISAMDVVLMGFNPRLKILQQPDKAMKVRAYEALSKVGLKDKINDSYLTLSEGQKQLCILARTLVADAKLLLLDEPESALDFKYRYMMMDILREWVSKERRGVIINLHDPQLALGYCDRLILLKNGRVEGIIDTKTDLKSDMEEKLRKIYGNISLMDVTDNKGKKHLIMLKEDGNETFD